MAGGRRCRPDGRAHVGFEMKIREEAASDRAEIAGLLGETFAGDREAELVARLRADNLIVLALVAEAGGKIVRWAGVD